MWTVGLLHWTISFLPIEPAWKFDRMVGLRASVDPALFGLEMEVDRQSTPWRLISPNGQAFVMGATIFRARTQRRSSSRRVLTLVVMEAGRFWGSGRASQRGQKG
jgi:hypothetical protein